MHFSSPLKHQRINACSSKCCALKILILHNKTNRFFGRLCPGLAWDVAENTDFVFSVESLQFGGRCLLFVLADSSNRKLTFDFLVNLLRCDYGEGQMNSEIMKKPKMMDSFMSGNCRQLRFFKIKMILRL